MSLQFLLIWNRSSVVHAADILFGAGQLLLERAHTGAA